MRQDTLCFWDFYFYYFFEFENTEKVVTDCSKTVELRNIVVEKEAESVERWLIYFVICLLKYLDRNIRKSTTIIQLITDVLRVQAEGGKLLFFIVFSPPILIIITFLFSQNQQCHSSPQGL